MDRASLYTKLTDGVQRLPEAHNQPVDRMRIVVLWLVKHHHMKDILVLSHRQTPWKLWSALVSCTSPSELSLSHEGNVERALSDSRDG